MTRIELPVLSFLAVLSLFAILPLHLRSRNIPFLFAIAWLLVCNIIQGVDAIVWADNALIRAEGWCDFVTLILYALRVALPAVALCVCRQLETVSSTRDVSYDPRTKYFTSVFHYVMCLVVPVIYAILHFVVQDRRFILVQEFGCQPAIYPSVPALFLTWFIPLILCITTVFYAGLSFYNYHRRCSFFNQHLNPRSKMTTAMFFRFVGTCLFLVPLTAFANIFEMSSLIGEFGLLEYASWTDVHQDNLILVISKGNGSQSAVSVRIRTEAIWWMAPIAALVLTAVFASTKECWVAGLEFCTTAKERAVGLFTPKQKFDLPIQQLEAVTVVPLTTPPKVAHDPFKSGWDDTLKSTEPLKKQTNFKSKVKVSPLRIHPPTLRFPSPTNSTSSGEEEGDASFAASTHNYLLSPTGKEALGRVGMIILSPISQSAVDLDDHAESQQLIRKPTVSKVEAVKLDKHIRAPSHGSPTKPEKTPTKFVSFTPLPEPTRPTARDSLLPEVRPRLPAEPAVERALRPSKSRENLSISDWPHPPTSIPLSPSPSPTTRNMSALSPTRSPSTPTPKGGNRDPYYDFVRQPSPTFSKATITDRDRAHIFAAPFLPSFTPPPPPPRVSPASRGSGITQADTVPELKEVQSKSPALVPARNSWKKWGSRNSQVSWIPVTGETGNEDVNAASPSVSSFVDSPSIYSTYSGNEPHAPGTA